MNLEKLVNSVWAYMMVGITLKELMPIMMENEFRKTGKQCVSLHDGRHYFERVNANHDGEWI